jgi:hypothetical protein
VSAVTPSPENTGIAGFSHDQGRESYDRHGARSNVNVPKFCFQSKALVFPGSGVIVDSPKGNTSGSSKRGLQKAEV